MEIWIRLTVQLKGLRKGMEAGAYPAVRAASCNLMFSTTEGPWPTFVHYIGFVDSVLFTPFLGQPLCFGYEESNLPHKDFCIITCILTQ